jgi:hypothetical protein
MSPALTEFVAGTAVMDEGCEEDSQIVLIQINYV